MKTLKDFYAMKDHMEIDHYTIGELRHAAKEWIKDMKIEEEKDWGKYEFGNFTADQVPYEANEIGAIIAWIKHFFGITEDDLK